MAQSVEMTASVVASRVSLLNQLLDDLDTAQPSLAHVEERQSASMWTDIPSCAAFVANYQDALWTTQQNLRTIRTEIEALAVGLKASADALTDIDETTRQDLVDLVARLDEDRPAQSPARPAGVVVDAPPANTPSGHM